MIKLDGGKVHHTQRIASHSIRRVTSPLKKTNVKDLTFEKMAVDEQLWGHLDFKGKANPQSTRQNPIKKQKEHT